MSFETDIRDFILGDATVSGLIGTRFYPLVLPQAPTYPAATFTTISAERPHNMQGPDDLAAQRLQLDAWAETFIAARALADAMREKIAGIRQTVGATVVQGIFFDTERHLHETDGSNLVTAFRISQDFICWFEE